MRTKARASSLWELWAVWLLFTLPATAVLETYWRLPPSQLWKVTNSGLVGGTSRVLVFLSFSAALAAPAVLAIAADRLDTRRASALALVATGLCASVAIPGVQTPGHLDAKWAQAPAVAGVVASIAITAWATLRGRVEARRTTRTSDRARIAAGAIVLVASAPYIAAELGFFLDGVPLLGWLFQTGKPAPEPGAGYVHATVHHGHHHGLDGFLLASTFLLLSRLVPTIRRSRLGTITAAYLSLMLAYALANLANDLWVEQVVKRGWTRWEIPDVLVPSASVGWGVILVAGAVVYVVVFRRRRPGRSAQQGLGGTPAAQP